MTRPDDQHRQGSTAAAEDDRTGGTRGDRTRRAIIAAARTRFAALGFEETTVVDVARDAGVSGPTVAFHFGSKQGLLTAVITDYYDDLVARIDDVIDAPTSPADRLVAFARFWVQAIDGGFELFGVFAAHGGMRAADSEPGIALRESNRRITRRFERLIEDLRSEGVVRAGVSTRLVRDAFFGTAEHVLRGRQHAGGPFDHARAADEILELVLHGAGGPPEPTVPDATRIDAIDRKLDLLLERTTGDGAGAP